MRASLTTVPAATFFAIVAGAALAAPQSLLVARTGEVALVCEDGACTAEVTTMCLEPENDHPWAGTPYSVVADGAHAAALRLVGVRPDGGEVSLPARTLKITAARADSAVRLGVEESVLEIHGVIRAAVKIARPAVLSPAEGLEPPGPDLAARARIGERILGKEGRDVAAARITQAAINGLPLSRGATETEYRSAWEGALAASQAGERPNDAMRARTRWAFEWCREPLGADEGGSADYRHCLGAAHYHLMGGVRRAFRASLAPAS
ncbi:MAG: hypothetical protein QGG17_04545 [Rhodospirillales bacterium]|jgi:hypothetical protein|nr:hypothetical protein [Rhodospirillales bacterium]MDP6804284.1 hypothetical protein [Rhodospirillales bacterium]